LNDGDDRAERGTGRQQETGGGFDPERSPTTRGEERQ
jgi:hypothetical protein